MRFLAMYRPDKLSPPTPEQIAEMGKLIQEMQRAGVLIVTEGFGPSTSTDARLRLTDGKITVTDGPFTESKELIAGFAMLQVRSRDEAIEWGKRFLKVAGDGESEIRPLMPAGSGC
jgi:hypothetical protein